MDENCEAASRQKDVRFATQRLGVQSEAKAAGVKGFPQRDFRFRILTPNRCHDA